MEEKNVSSYQSPHLVLLGTLADLTASGSVDTPENTGQGGLARRPVGG